MTLIAFFGLPFLGFAEPKIMSLSEDFREIRISKMPSCQNPEIDSLRVLFPSLLTKVKEDGRVVFSHPTFGVGDEYLFCESLVLEVHNKFPQPVFLSFEEDYLKNLNLILVDSENHLLQHEVLSRSDLFAEREVQTVRHSIQLKVSNRTSKQVVMILRHQNSLVAPFQIQNTASLLRQTEVQATVLSLCNGIHLALTALISIAALIFRRKDYFWLATISVVSFFFQWSTSGQLIAFLGGNHTWWYEHDMPFLMMAASYCSLRYATEFLCSADFHPLWHRISRYKMALYIIMGLLSLTSARSEIAIAASVLLLILPVHLAVGAILVTKQKQLQGVWYLVAHGLGSVGLLVHVLSVLGFLDINRFYLNVISSIGTIQGLLLNGIGVSWLVFRLKAGERKWGAIELLAARAQLSPHFVSNALNAISFLLYSNPEEAETAIERLAELHRLVTESLSRQMNPLAREIMLVERYIQIEMLRFGSRVKWNLEVDNLPGDQNQIIVPALLIQILVENAFKHGAAQNIQTTIIHVKISMQDSHRCKIEVTNTLPAESDEQMSTALAQSNNGTGLKNTARRLALIYGKEASLVFVREGFAQTAEPRAIATVEIPMKTDSWRSSLFLSS